MSIWRLLLLAVLVHLFRRLPVVTALYKFIPAIRTWREAVFTGWFGPMGVGSVFYCTVAIASFAPDGPNAYALQLIEPIVYFIVLSSVLVHGITVPLFHIGKIAHISLSFTAVSVKSSEVDEETLVSLCMSQKNTQKLFTDLTFFFCRYLLLLHPMAQSMQTLQLLQLDIYQGFRYQPCPVVCCNI